MNHHPAAATRPTERARPPLLIPTTGNSGISSSGKSLGKRIKRLFSRPHFCFFRSVAAVEIDWQLEPRTVQKVSEKEVGNN